MTTILITLLRSGKTSIQQVLFNNLPPKQTFYLETTIRIVKHTFECVWNHRTRLHFSTDLPSVQSFHSKYGIAREMSQQNLLEHLSANSQL